MKYLFVERNLETRSVAFLHLITIGIGKHLLEGNGIIREMQISPPFISLLGINILDPSTATHKEGEGGGEKQNESPQTERISHSFTS
ncbi:MAG: hypothetical protein OXU73_01040 [Candidatus Campbellbacteria bacterium]|nr:hypothetical protein [Candidatus Campbellbacteria bacterium]